MNQIYVDRRKKVMDCLGDGEMLVLYSGMPVPMSMDECYPFEANRHFYYLTGLRRENMALLLSKTGDEPREILYIEPAIPKMERWTGKRVTREEAIRISGMSSVQFIGALEDMISRICAREFPKAVWMDTHVEDGKALPMYNVVKAKEFLGKYPGVQVRDLHPVVSRIRMIKDAEEIACFREAIRMTNKGLERVMDRLHPGMMEYQVQADFEYEIRNQGSEHTSFPTIVGSGKNGCSLHYESNDAEIGDGNLVLLDLGARYKGYCADISRTYPASGTYTEAQRTYYEIVLEANRAVEASAKPGMTIKQLTELCKDVLAEGLIRLGKIKGKEEIGNYFMHGVSHFIGLDTHDVYDALNCPLEPGMIISNEPGLYIDDEAIGIRIEDDLLITENGCENLSREIEKDPDHIERIMAGRKRA